MKYYLGSRQKKYFSYFSMKTYIVAGQNNFHLENKFF